MNNNNNNKERTRSIRPKSHETHMWATSLYE